jgi:hypothetical protein
MNRTFSALAFIAVAATPVAAQQVMITGGAKDAAKVVVSVPVGNNANSNAVTLPNGQHTPAQVVPPSLLDERKGKRLVFLLPHVKAGEKLAVTPTTLNYVVAPPHFEFVTKKGQPTELVWATLKSKRPVLQYFNLPHDPENHYYTFKPFHNVYDPEIGKVMLTNTSARTAKDGQFPHHRGLFFGWNRVSYDGQTADVWHGTNNVFSTHDKTLSEEAGEVLGRQRSAISWHGKDGETFVKETREVTAYATPGGTLIDFASILTTDRDSVKLDGDPQHAGFHFRANQEVSKNGKANTYYLRPDGKGKVGETRNWDAKGKNPKTINLPWNAMSFMVGGKRYTVLRINHPDNPGESRGSERDYGRFGDYFEYELTPKKPLKVKYRVWLQEGEMTVDECNAIAAAFVTPPTAK